MHELSLALSILEIVGGEVARVDRSMQEVREVGVRIGSLSGVEPEALDFAWEAVRADGGCEKACLAIEVVPAAAICERCGARFRLGQGEGQCETCGTAPFRLIEGRELEVRRIVCEDSEESGIADAAASGGGRKG